MVFYGEMSELAEGARLEIACAAKGGTEGSNPSLSAIYLINSIACKPGSTRATIIKMDPCPAFAFPLQSFCTFPRVPVCCPGLRQLP